MLTLPSLDHISELPGVYVFRDGKKKILYIGKAKNLRKRVGHYFAPGSVWKQDMMSKADEVEFLVCQSEQEALVLESNMIKKHYPPFNRLLKWDNSYVYIKITNHQWPQILLTRYRSDDGAIYLGPKNNTMELRKLLQRMRQFLQYRACKDIQFSQGELCNDYVFGLCKGRCVYAKIEEMRSVKAVKSDKGDISWGERVGQEKKPSTQEAKLDLILEKARRLGFKPEMEVL
jgi:excinuclease ABC subunit C